MNTFEKMLVTIFFVELFVGGGGRLIDFGFLSIRQVLFILLFLTFLFRIVKEKAFFNKDVNTFIRFNLVSVGVYILIAWFLVSALIGLLNGNPRSIIVMDFFRVSFFAAYFPLVYYISERRYSKKKIISLLKYGALAVAIYTIVIALLGKTVFSSNFESYMSFWKSFMNDDLLFRKSHSVFYKSHFYVLIGLILSLNDILSKKYSMINTLNVIFCSISIFWSDTRGFSIALLVSLFVIVFFDMKIFTDSIIKWSLKVKRIVKNRQIVSKVIVLVLLTILVPYLYQYTTMERFSDQTNQEDSDVKDTSVGARIEFLLDSKNILLGDPINFIFGEGYGTSIAGRVEGIEMSFLDIWVEQGAVGLSIWLYLCLLVLYHYHIAYKNGKEITTVDRSLIGAFVGMVLLTNINPFINNPIGIVFFLLVLIFAQKKNIEEDLQEQAFGHRRNDV
jgi:hypothetical protein